MYGYGSVESSTVRDLISQMAVEMEKKANECQALREEIARKDRDLEQALSQVKTLENRLRRSSDECAAAMRNLGAAQEDREKIAGILGYKNDKNSMARQSLKSIPDPSVDPSCVYSGIGHSNEVSDLSGFAQATLDRMRGYN